VVQSDNATEPYIHPTMSAGKVAVNAAKAMQLYVRRSWADDCKRAGCQGVFNKSIIRY
jgi:hypothetical protein